ncbi:CHAT domain-containing tetratricopeptide repeat protein [Ichthyenterobacterium sp. W332]|uniref:CHAT domain-containing tetratricopeptide repeat protein n=1 Tax=Microcosmobacter mediterraneus TaxID=3075607 RepID=A0ABU2YFY4_9FLAO|nr:CHAT domain-containing tetratricopeptide repeat protein [Ichthyenterobacterium sp. W332]MDT0557094.1 CHAT domain-containing tetratricopeptide repeat protein [Ichthyenterobacterium sp. W332]
MLLLTSILIVFNSFAQSDTLVGPAKIDALLKVQNVEEAKKELYKQIEYFKSIKDYDTLPQYIEYIGHKVLANDNWNTAVKNSEAFVQELIEYNSPKISLYAYKNLAWIYSDAGHPDLAYKASETALTFANQLSERKNEVTAEVQYNLGYYASSMGNFSASNKHYKKSLAFLKQSDKQDYEFYQQIYNSLGGVMWNQAKMDSCLYYFEASKKALEKTDPTPINLYYRPALVSMNLAIVANNLGKNSDAISYSKEAITNFQRYQGTGKDEQKKRGAKRSQLAAIDNLGVFYNSIGEFSKAEELITYSFNQKKKDLNEDDPNIIISKIILAQAKINTQDLKGAETLLKSAIESSEDNPERVLYWYMSANSTLAKVLSNQGRFNEALSYTKTGERYMRSYYKGNYNKDLLDELSSMAVAYSDNGYKEKALELAEEVYTQIKQGDFKNTMQDLISTTAIAKINYKLKNYEAAIRYSNEVINFNNNILKNSQTADAVLMDYSKPLAILINAKSNYELLENPKVEDIKKELLKIEDGIELIAKRKSIIGSHEDVSLLISQHNDLFNFAKKLRLKLYELTKEKRYLDDIITLHESALYNRIRSRLNLKDDIAFANIPESVLKREKDLKRTLSSSLSNNYTIDDFFSAQTNWVNFRDSLRTNYPKYYQMRYSTLEESSANLQNNIPDNSTIIRYLYIEENLYAFIVTKTDKALVRLNSTSLSDQIKTLSENQQNITQLSKIYYKLYNQIWKPFESYIKTDKIIIIPDAELFNLSFETLTPKPIQSFKDLAINSLLAKHKISYNYSLLLLDESKNTINYSNDFIAFAPEFNDDMKNDYKLAISDSVTIDKIYLTLLPQPLSVDLAKEYSRVFGGHTFLNDKATKQVFTNEANEHKIIHIGTHAESNNVSPELSRLIFAKSANRDDNYLHTYEIYNLNLNANLAILTACETGKPTYQAGEGMISLAHAFNYAGSESILTSLWKIDEQSSTEIIELFYNGLNDGLPKDEALRQAKLNYMASAEGRTIVPQYWAGLILIGDASPINFKTSSHLVFWILGFIFILLFGIIINKKRAA